MSKKDGGLRFLDHIQTGICDPEKELKRRTFKVIAFQVMGNWQRFTKHDSGSTLLACAAKNKGATEGTKEGTNLW